MKKVHACVGLLALGVFGQLAMADGISVTFVNAENSQIVFTGNGFPTNDSKISFTNNFVFASMTGPWNPAGTLSGLQGYITGTYQISDITVAGPFITADVTGTGSLVIKDGPAGPHEHDFTATLAWNNIESVPIASLNLLNYTDDFNLGVGGCCANMSYGGTNADLKQLVTADGVVGDHAILSSTKTPTLTQLEKGGLRSGYTLTISALPEPGFYGVLCVALISLVGAGKFVAAKARRSQKS